MPVKVVIVDDNPTIRHAVRTFLQSKTGWQVRGEAEDGAAAIDLVQSLKPDLLVLDLSRPVMNGLDAARKITVICPTVGMVLFTAHASEQLEIEAKRAGVEAIVPKDGNASLEQLTATLQALVSTDRAA